MMNQDHERNMIKLLEALRADGIPVGRCGRSCFVCSLNTYPNYVLEVSTTDLSLANARDIEHMRLANWAERYKQWEKAALADAAEAERRAIEHHAMVENCLKRLNELR